MTACDRQCVTWMVKQFKKIHGFAKKTAACGLPAALETSLQRRMKSGKNKTWVGYVSMHTLIKWFDEEVFVELGVDDPPNAKLRSIVKSVRVK